MNNRPNTSKKVPKGHERESRQVIGEAYKWHERQAYALSETACDIAQQEVATARIVVEAEARD